MVPESDYRELEHKNGRSQEECLANTAELALIKAETPQIIANMAHLEAKRKALVLLHHQRGKANQQKR